MQRNYQERGNCMQLTIREPGFAYMMEGILQFQTEDTTSFWSEPLYRFYPQIVRDKVESLPLEARKQYLTDVLQDIYTEQKSVLQGKVVSYTQYWEQCQPQITAALSDAFEVDCRDLYNDMRCNVSLNPIEPRYLDTHTFDIFYLNSERGFVGEAIHEIIHFVWFYVWQQVFQDSMEEYESPSLKWILSEMVVESIMKDPRLCEINPYFKRENGGCIYPYFFDMQVEGVPVLDTLDEMYRTQKIKDFMKNSYSYCQQHENEIREQIRRAEQG